jgi:hypothetical protein
MKQSSWEANSHSASQEILSLFRNPKVHYRVHKSLLHELKNKESLNVNFTEHRKWNLMSVTSINTSTRLNSENTLTLTELINLQLTNPKPLSFFGE